MALTDAFKLSIDVQLGAIEIVTPVLAKTKILKIYQPHMGKQKPKTSIIAQTSAKALGRIQNMDPVHRPALIFKRKSALLILYENLPEFRI